MTHIHLVPTDRAVTRRAVKATVDVTQQDIDTFWTAFNGTANYCVIAGCPIALAVKRLFPSKEVNIGFHFIYIDGRRFAATKPNIVEEFAHLHFAPVTFGIVEDLYDSED